jgi:penicillin-binding protein 1C
MHQQKRPLWHWLIMIPGGLFLLLLAGYLYLAWLLPLPDSLNLRPQHLSSKILDRHGNLLYEVLSPGQGRKTYLRLEEMPPRFIEAVLAGEDGNFYGHVGVDLGAIARALYYNYLEQKVTSGASTITQQLVRNLLGTNRQRNLGEKLLETAYAIRLSHAYSKDQVLEQYLNTVYFGNLSYGAGEAALNYFGKNLSELDLAELSLLAGLPQSPTAYNPLLYPDKAKKRQSYILGRLVENGQISAEQAEEAAVRPLRFASGRTSIRAPHFVHYLLGQLEEQYGPDFIHQGLTIKTTLDLPLQEEAESIIERSLERLRDKNVGNAALLAATVPDGQVLVWLGSRDYFDDAIAGQVDLITSLRQPGSALKPFLYLQALEQGDTLATIIPDLPLKVQTASGTYAPLNYDLDFHGPVRLKEALANSFNIPAVRTQEKIGTANFLAFLRRLGLDTLDQKPDYYGLALTLGGGEIRLRDLANAYLTLANYGSRREFSTILSISDTSGKEIYHWRGASPRNLLGARGRQNAALIIEALSDPAARLKSFGEGNLLELSVPAAAKTGTTRNFRDNWTFGFTPSLLTAVWVGNADATPMENISGIDGAGPIWHDFMEYYAARQPGGGRQPGGARTATAGGWSGFGNGGFPMPAGLTQNEICAVSGLLPGTNCQEVLREWFINGTEPRQLDNFWQAFNCGAGTAPTPAPAAGISDSTAPAPTRYYIDYHFPYADWAAERGYLPPPDCRRLPSPIPAGATDANILYPGGGSASTDNYSETKNLFRNKNIFNFRTTDSATTPPDLWSVTITAPLAGDAYEINPELPLEVQQIPLRVQVAAPATATATSVLQLLIDGEIVLEEELGKAGESGGWRTGEPREIRRLWLPVRGSHSLTARLVADGAEKGAAGPIGFEVR